MPTVPRRAAGIPSDLFAGTDAALHCTCAGKGPKRNHWQPGGAWREAAVGRLRRIPLRCWDGCGLSRRRLWRDDRRFIDLTRCCYL